MKIALITACCAKKLPHPAPAIKFYRSSRIKAVYIRRSGADFYILSAKYGLVKADQVIKPYDEVMTSFKAGKLAPQIAETLKQYDYIIFYRAGARKQYLDCIIQACQLAKKPLIIVGYGQIGDINKIPQIIQLVKSGKLAETRKMCKQINPP